MVEALGRTEQEYLDLAQTFKDRMDEKDREQISLKQTYMELKKHMTQIYGIMRTMEQWLMKCW